MGDAAHALSSIRFYATPPDDCGESVKLVTRAKPDGRLPTGAELLDLLLVKFKLKEAPTRTGSEAPSRMDEDRTWLLRNKTRESWVALDRGVEDSVADDDQLELYQRSVAGGAA